MVKSANTTGSRKTRSTRETILNVASDLFYREGIRAVGVETVVSKAGVAKISLYRNFSSKDELITAYLSERSESFLRQWDEAFETHKNPRKKLRAIMTYLMERTTQPHYRGCPFINFCSEYPDRSHPGRDVARATKVALRDRFVSLAGALGVRKSRELADGLLLLVEGAYAISQTLDGGANGAGIALLAASEAMVEGFS